MSVKVARLAAELPTGSVITDPEILATYREDRSAFTVAGRPIGAVMARSIGDVQATVSFANDEEIPIVARGAGSGLSGGANAVDGCLMLVMSPMNSISDIDKHGLTAEVEAGVINYDLKRSASELGLFYPPDPASSEFSSIGGNVATNAGGLCCVKYGVTRDYVNGLTVVLADGSVLRTGGRTRKSSAGYDLTGLMVGSEGTLGIVVGATLRLVPAPPPAATLVTIFPSVVDAARIPGELAAAGITPSLLEVMDRHTIRAVEAFAPMGLDLNATAMVIAQSDAPNAGDDVRRIAAISQKLGAGDVFHSDDPIEASMLLQARRVAFTALEAGTHVTVLDDIGVPIPQLASMVTGIDEIARQHQVSVATFGHLGDGNLHPTIRFSPEDDAEAGRAQDAFEDILSLALHLGGTVTGEHGVGTLKTTSLDRQLEPPAKRVHQVIKQSLDPRRILNPNKGLPVA